MGWYMITVFEYTVKVIIVSVIEDRILDSSYHHSNLVLIS